MRNAKDYIRDDGPGRQTVTSLAYWLTPDGICSVHAAMIRQFIAEWSDEDFLEAFDGASKSDARQFLDIWELCYMPAWGVHEVAIAINVAEPGRNQAMTLRAVELAQQAGELPYTFAALQGIEWAMARGYLITREMCELVGAQPGVFGHPHNPLRIEAEEIVGSTAEPERIPDLQATSIPKQAKTDKTGETSIRHRLKSRSHPLDAIIAKAEQDAADPLDYQSVWAALVKIAEAASRLAPLIGYADGEGVKYRCDQATGGVGIFTKKALAERYRRRAKPR